MKQLQLPRANTITNDAFTGPAGELTADLDRWELRLHDNETPGGHRILNLEQLIEIFMSKDSEFGQVVFAESDRGVLTRIGDRQYALRLLKGYNGIHVTEANTGDVDNPAGTAADFWIGLDPDALATLLLGLASGKLLYAGLSGGTADALTLTVPTGWKNDQGSIVAFKSHINVHDSATMQITVGATAGSVLPLMTAAGSDKIGQLIKLGTVPLLMRIDRIDTGADDSLVGDADQILTGYRCIGFMTAKEIGIAPISGMTSTNVQDALAELKAGLGGGGGDDAGNDSSFWTFANFNQSANAGFAVGQIPLAAGQRKLVTGVGHGGSRHSGGSSGDTVAVPGVLYCMGNRLNVLPYGGNVASPTGSDSSIKAIMHREGNNIWLCPMHDLYNHTADSKYRVGEKIHIGTLNTADTSVPVGGTNPNGSVGQTWTYSDTGVVAT